MSKPLLVIDRAARQAARSATQGPRAAHGVLAAQGTAAPGRICFFAGFRWTPSTRQAPLLTRFPFSADDGLFPATKLTKRTLYIIS